MANEKRLIDANALWEKFESEPWYENADRDEIALPMVDDAPTVDAVEVVHAQWKVECKDRLKCSNCGLGRNAETQLEWDYCPRCGAKMDLEG